MSDIKDIGIDQIIEYNEELGEETLQQRIKNGTDNYEGSTLNGIGGEDNE